MTMQTSQDLMKLNKEQLVAMIVDLQEQVDKKQNRDRGFMQEHLYKLLVENQPISRQDLADLANSTPNSVSSYMTYLRKKGVNVGKNHKGKYMIFTDDEE